MLLRFTRFSLFSVFFASSSFFFLNHFFTASTVFDIASGIILTNTTIIKSSISPTNTQPQISITSVDISTTFIIRAETKEARIRSSLKMLVELLKLLLKGLSTSKYRSIYAVRSGVYGDNQEDCCD